MSETLIDESWKCEKCGQRNASWTKECGRCAPDGDTTFTERIRLERELAAMTAERDALRADSDRLRQDRADLLNVKTKEGLGASEWMMRTATAERELAAAIKERDFAAEQLKGVCALNRTMREEKDKLTKERDALAERLKRAEEALRILTAGIGDGERCWDYSKHVTDTARGGLWIDHSPDAGEEVRG